MDKDRVFFISDVHFGIDAPSQERLKERMLHTFLQHVQERSECLFILGDLFDVWFEYKRVIPSRYFRILYFLQDTLERGVKIHYILGNHDYWANSLFFQSMGMVVHRKPFFIDMMGKKLFISHGDDSGYNDRGYQILKRVIRNRAMITVMSLLHPDLGLSLAERISRLSRKHSTDERKVTYDRYISDVANPMFNKGADFVIIGHIHSPFLRRMNGKVFVNIGNWYADFTYARFESNGEIYLERWSQAE